MPEFQKSLTPEIATSTPPSTSSAMSSVAPSEYSIDKQKSTVIVEAYPASEKEEEDNSQSASTETPYHVFALGKKKRLVYIVSLAGLFSPLSSNIYFPALNTIANVSVFILCFCFGLTSQTCFVVCVGLIGWAPRWLLHSICP